jgi:hypothetical protein
MFSLVQVEGKPHISPNLTILILASKSGAGEMTIFVNTHMKHTKAKSTMSLHLDTILTILTSLALTRQLLWPNRWMAVEF